MIGSVEKNVRDSNMELLRIISMLFVLGLHVNFAAIKMPTQMDVVTYPLNAFCRFFSEGLCIIAVNTFVLISGWFGIRASIKGFCKLVFQCLFIGLVITLGYCAVTKSMDAFTFDTLLLRTGNLWFVYAYIGLYILSPILNAYIESASQKSHLTILVAFYVLQTWIAWYRGFVGWYSNGYSTLSFVGLYLLAQYIRKYPTKYKDLSSLTHLLIVLLCSLSIGILASVATYYDKMGIASALYGYVNPIVIVSAMSMTLAFSKVRIQSVIINFLGGACLAVYLLHSHPCLFGIYKSTACKIYEMYSGVSYWLLIIGFICAVFIVAILLDKVRIFVWNKLEQKFVVKN